MVSTIAVLLFSTATCLAVWAIAGTLHAHAGQIARVMGKAKPLPLPAAPRLNADFRRPVSVTPLRRSSLRAAA